MIISDISVDEFIGEMTDRFVFSLDLLIGELNAYISLFAGALIFIFVGYKVALYMLNPDKGLDPYVLVRPCLILIGIVLYKELVQLFMITPMEYLAKAVEYAVVDVLDPGAELGVLDVKYKAVIEQTDENLYDVLQIHPIMEGVHLVIFFVGSLVASYMLLKQALTIAIYYIMGYFSLLFSLIPGNEKSFYNWSLSFLALLLWGPFIILLKFIIVLTKLDAQNAHTWWVVMAVQIATITLFLKIPQFCEFLINGGSPLGSPHAGGGIGAMRTMYANYKGIKSLMTKSK